MAYGMHHNGQLGFGGMGFPPMPLPGSQQLAGIGVPMASTPANIAMAAPASTQPTGTMPVTPLPPTTTPDVTPDVAGQGGWFSKMGGMEGIGSIMDGLSSLGQVYGALQGVKLAKEQLAFSKESYATNLGNQTQSYNTELEDRARARAAGTGGSAASVDRYLKKHSL